MILRGFFILHSLPSVINNSSTLSCSIKIKVMRFSRVLLFFFPMILLLVACQSSSDKKETSVSIPPSTQKPVDPKTPAASKHSSGLPTKTLNGIKITPVDFPGQTFMILRSRKQPFREIQPFYVKSMNTLFTACQAHGLEFDGMPSCLFYKYYEEEGYTDMAASIAVKQGKDVGMGIEVLKIPATNRALQVDFYGDYKDIANVHYNMEDYMNDLKIKPSNEYPLIEEYVTEPSSQPDPKKRLTRVTYFY